MFNDLQYYRPQSLAELWDMRQKSQGFRYLAGGTDLLVKMKNRLESPEALISIRSLKELRVLEWKDCCSIGAAATISEIIADSKIKESYPALIEAAKALGSVQIRNTATIGGNLCNASPAADMAPPLLAMEAEVVLQSFDKQRRMPLKDFFVGPSQTALEEGELMTAIEIPLSSPGCRSIYLRKGRVKMDLAKAGLAVLIEKEGEKLKTVRIAAGAVAPVPLRLLETEAVLTGKILTEELIREGQAIASEEISPIDDLRSTKEYRKDLISALLKEALQKLQP